MTKQTPEINQDIGQQSKIDPREFYTTSELAKILKVHTNTVLNLKEKFQGEKIGKNYRFFGENVMAFFSAPSVVRR